MKRRRRILAPLLGTVALAVSLHALRQADQTASAPPLTETRHPSISLDADSLWYVPPPDSRAELAERYATLSAAMELVDQEDYAQAVSMLDGASRADADLRDYAVYYMALAQLGLEHAEEARRIFQELQARPPTGYLTEAAERAEGESAEALDDVRGAVEIYSRLAMGVTLTPEEILMRLGRAAKAANDSKRAADAFGSVYYGFPLSSIAEEAGDEYLALPDLPDITPGSERYRLELVRAERLFSARRFTDASQAFGRLAAVAAEEDRPLIQLRRAECDFHLRQYRSARRELARSATSGPLRAEASYFLARTERALGRHAAYVKQIRQIAREFPTDLWVEDALDNLATHYILVDDDPAADGVFRELYERFPKGRYAQRAAWKIGWRAYRERRYAETVRCFERAAADFPRSDYRPAWIYWAGRAHAALHDDALAVARFELVVHDYRNSYYGRLAVNRLRGREPRPPADGTSTPDSVVPPRNLAIVQALIGARRFEDALNELQYAQRAWGDSAPIQATIAWLLRERGRTESGREQFVLLRGSINTMRQAYPQFMAAGGEGLPREILTTIFPLSYWDLIQEHARANGLDAYLVAALVAQESTFVSDIESVANAVGLMQLIPRTARLYARRLDLSYSAGLLRQPEPNIRMGTAYLADKIAEFGSIHLALASYNAGERPVRRWIAERPGLVDHEEFIDDIPYPETQLYVKRILGTAEDYRSLYGPPAD